MDIRRLILTAGFVVIAVGAVLAIIQQSPGSELIAFFGTLGLVGGAIALLTRSRWTASSRFSSDPFANEAQSTDVINFARLRVAGLGGLGLVVVCLGIAIALPRIGQTMALAAIGGVLVAYGIIRRRRERGPLDSSHAQPGARSMLVEPDAARRAPEPVDPPEASHERRRAAVPMA